MLERIQDFKLGGTHLRKLRRVEGGAKIFGVFRVKNHDFTPKKIIFFPILGGVGSRWVRTPLDPPLVCNTNNHLLLQTIQQQKIRLRHIAMEIEVMTWDRYTKVVGLNRLIQPFSLITGSLLY